MLLVQKVILSNDLLFVVVFPPERSIWNGQRSCLHSQILVRPGNPEFARVYLRSLEAPDWLLSKRLVSWEGFKQISKPEPLNNLGEKDEDLQLSEPLADAHPGALPEREAHERMNCLLGEKRYMSFYHTYTILTYSFSDFIHLSGRNTSGLLINWRGDESMLNSRCQFQNLLI